MGLFGGTEITKVGTTVSRVMEDDLIPNSVQQAVIRALYAGSNLTDSIVSHLNGSIGVKANQMYRYAEKEEGGYVYGLPSGEFTSASVAAPEIQAILRREFNNDLIVVDYVRFGIANLYHMAWMTLVNDYDYDSTTNVINGLEPVPTFPVSLKDLWIQVSSIYLENSTISKDSFIKWEDPPKYRGTLLDTSKNSNLNANFHTLPRWTGLDTGPVAIVTSEYPIKGENFRPPEEEQIEEEYPITLSLDGFDMSKEYFHVRYSIEGRRYFWMYEIGKGTYPELDGYFENPDNTKTMGEFYPFVYFRHDKTSIADLPNQEEYKSSKKMAKYLGMDYDAILEAVHENPDIGDIEQAMMVMALPDISEDPLENQYLFAFFDKLFEFQDNQFSYPEQAAKAWYEGRLFMDMDEAYVRNAIIIQDKKFKMALSNRGIYKKRKAGTIGEIGYCSSAYEIRPTTIEGVDLDTGDVEPIFATIREHTYCKQISTGIYEEILVVDLQLRYHIWDVYATTGDEEDDILLIPIDKIIIEDFSIPDKEYLFARSLHYVFNSRITIKTKWYESGFFQFVVTLVSTVITAGTMGPFISMLNANLIMGTMTALQVLGKLGIMLLKGIVASIVISLVVDAIGIQASLIAAAILTIASFAGASIGSENSLVNLTAVDFLNAALGIVKSAGESVVEALRLISEEFTNFLQEAQESMKLLEEADDLLKPSSLLSPFIYLGESAEAFYNRTIHSGNVGILAIEAQSNYVSQALRLPSIQDTLGEKYYVA